MYPNDSRILIGDNKLYSCGGPSMCIIFIVVGTTTGLSPLSTRLHRRNPIQILLRPIEGK